MKLNVQNIKNKKVQNVKNVILLGSGMIQLSNNAWIKLPVILNAKEALKLKITSVNAVPIVFLWDGFG